MYVNIQICNLNFGEPLLKTCIVCWDNLSIFVDKNNCLFCKMQRLVLNISV